MKLFDTRQKNIILDIGTRYTKALYLEDNGDDNIKINYSIEDSNFKFNFLPLQECKIENDEEFLEVLRHTYSKLRTMEKNVFITIPDHAVIIRLITISSDEVEKSSSQEEIRKLVLKKLKPTLPISIDRWFFDLQEVENTGNKRIYLVEAILRHNLFEIEKQVRRIGLNPVGVDINSFNTVNLFSSYLEDEKNMDKNISIVNLNNKSTTIMVFRNGNLRTAQTRLIGGNDFTKKISENKNISLKEAEKIKFNQTIFLPEIDDEQEKIINYNIIKPVFSELIMSLFNMYEYYTENFKESEINEIILTGGFSNLANIAKQLESRLNIKVLKGDTLLNIVDKKGEKVSSNHINILSSALGSALRG